MGLEIRVGDEALFKNLKGEMLRQYIRDGDLDGTKVQLQEVLHRINKRYGKEEDEQSRKARKLRKLERIKVYNNLLLLALGAEGDDYDIWLKRDSTLWDDKTTLHLAPGSIFAYLLDQIHEDEEIMFSYYHVQNKSRDSLQEKAFWLVESMKMYRKHLVSPVVEALQESPKEETEAVRKELLHKAKEAFKARVSSHGRSWSERSWRNRARLYWLLDLAKHALISNGRVAKFKSIAYEGPIGTLVREMIEEDKEMLLEKDGDSLFHYMKTKFDKRKKDVKLGTFKICRLLAWASAAGDHDLVMCILQHKDEYVKSDECDWKWEEKWEESWANALWNAAYKGHEKIVRELLSKRTELYSTDRFSKNSMLPPLHVAAGRGHISVVEVFCSKEFKNISCHEEDHQFHQTPLEVATNLKDKPIKKMIQNVLLQRPEVKQAVEESYRQRELTYGSANAIMVGAALIASVTYAGWLQPPLGYHTYLDTSESYMFVQGHKTIRLFAIFNSLSFFFAIAAIVAGMETACFIEAPEDTYITETVRKLRFKLKRTTILFIVSVVFVLLAFGSAGIAILPPIERYQRDIYITIGVGGSICLAFIGRMLFSTVSKRRLYKRTRSHLGRMFTKVKETFWNFLSLCLPSTCLEVWKKIKYLLEEDN